MCSSQHMCGGQRKTWRSWCSPSTMWVQRADLRSPRLAEWVKVRAALPDKLSLVPRIYSTGSVTPVHPWGKRVETGHPAKACAPASLCTLLKKPFFKQGGKGRANTQSSLLTSTRADIRISHPHTGICVCTHTQGFLTPEAKNNKTPASW